MPLPINLDALLHGRTVEWERLEFKAGWNPLSVLHTLCAFANDLHNLGGGYLFVGIAEENGRPVLPPDGLDTAQLDAIQKELLELSHSALQPHYYPIVEPVLVQGRQVLALWVPGGQTRPYKAKVTLGRDAKEWSYYVRKGSATVRAGAEDEVELLNLAATVPFDDRVNQRARLEDLSRDLMEAYLYEVNSALAPDAPGLSLGELAHQMGVADGPPEALLPKNVGLMVFNPEPERFFPATQVDVVWFGPQGPGGNQFLEKTFRGPVPRMARESLDFIRRNVLTELVTKHLDRAESTRVHNFPFAALEESVVNALYHRGYDEREPVEIRISAQDIVVLSYPGPDRSVRLELLRQGRAAARRYRNRRLGEFLKELQLTEGRATGIPRIIAAMNTNGSPPPEFEFDEAHTYFQVRLPVHPAVSVPAPFPEKGSESVATGQVTGQVTDWIIRVLSAAISGPLKSSEIQKLAAIKHRETFQRNYLDLLLNRGWMERTLPDKPTSQAQRYRLTSEGASYLGRQLNPRNSN